MARIDDVLYVDDLTKHSDQLLSISKVGVMAHKGLPIPYSVPVPNTPYKTAFTTPSFSPAQLVSPANGDRSTFINECNIRHHRGIGVKKVLTDYLNVEGSDTAQAASAHRTASEYFEHRKGGVSPLRHGSVVEG